MAARDWDATGKLATSIIATSGLVLSVMNYRRGRDQYVHEIWLSSPRYDRGKWRITIKVANLGNKPFAIKRVTIEGAAGGKGRAYYTTIYDLMQDEENSILPPGGVRTIEGNYEAHADSVVRVELHNGVQRETNIGRQAPTTEDVARLGLTLILSAFEDADVKSVVPTVLIEKNGLEYEMSPFRLMEGDRTIGKVDKLPTENPFRTLVDAYPDLFALDFGDGFTLRWRREAADAHQHPDLYYDWLKKYEAVLPEPFTHIQFYIDLDGSVQVEEWQVEGVPHSKQPEVASTLTAILGDAVADNVDPEPLLESVMIYRRGPRRHASQDELATMSNGPSEP